MAWMAAHPRRGGDAAPGLIPVDAVTTRWHRDGDDDDADDDHRDDVPDRVRDEEDGFFFRGVGAGEERGEGEEGKENGEEEGEEGEEEREKEDKEEGEEGRRRGRSPVPSNRRSRDGRVGMQHDDFLPGRRYGDAPLFRGWWGSLGPRFPPAVTTPRSPAHELRMSTMINNQTAHPGAHPPSSPRTSPGLGGEELAAVLDRIDRSRGPSASSACVRTPKPSSRLLPLRRDPRRCSPHAPPPSPPAALERRYTNRRATVRANQRQVDVRRVRRLEQVAHQRRQRRR